MSTALFYGFSREYLLYLYHYDPITGVVTSRVARGRHGCHRAGRVIGYQEPNGYVRVNIEGCMVRLHQLIWFMQTGDVPQRIDHKNLDKSDHAWLNLREATGSQNGSNRTVGVNNKSGFKGVSLDVATGQWRACIGVNGRSLKFERTDNRLHAAATYNYWALRYFGEFARLNDIPALGPIAVPIDSIGLYL